MRCASCGEKIDDNPIWRGDEAYCSEECVEIGAMENDYEDEEDCVEKEEEEEI